MPTKRDTFTRDEIAEMKRLVRRKQTAAADEQKTIRSALRRMGFFIGDYADYAGFVESDLDELIERGTIRIIE